MVLTEMNDYLKHLSNAPYLIKQTLIYLVFLLTLVLGFLIDNSKQITELSNLQKETITLKANYLLRLQKTHQNQQILNQYPELKINAKALNYTLPKTIDLAQQLQEINKIGLEAGLQLILFKPDKVIFKHYYSEYPISINVSGNYTELFHFINGISAMPYLSTLNNIHIESKDTNGNLLMTASIINYCDSQHE